MLMGQVEFIPTLNEYTDFHKDNPDTFISAMIDDFCEFPERDKDPTEENNELFEARTILRAGFIDRADDIIIFNRYAMNQYNHQVEEATEGFVFIDENYEGMFSSILEEQDENNILEARMIYPNFNWYCELHNARTIANEGLIIHLWSTIEQYIKRSILAMDKKIERTPYEWKKIKELAKSVGLDLRCLPSYEIIDELRVVNNKIKHLYIVDNDLCKYKGFAEHKGKKMNNVNYRVHDYAIGAHHFINRLVNSMGPTIRFEREPSEDEAV